MSVLHRSPEVQLSSPLGLELALLAHRSLANSTRSATHRLENENAASSEYTRLPIVGVGRYIKRSLSAECYWRRGSPSGEEYHIAAGACSSGQLRGLCAC